jgi:SAM-dependent methyltransferase
MGTARIQGELWGARAADWAELGEPLSRPAYEAVFKRAGVGQGTRVLDLGCGAGTALALARSLGAEVAGLDASDALLAIAHVRVPAAHLEAGDLEALPFDDRSFDLVTGFNAFQFAGDLPKALAEAGRVCRPGGAVAMCVWGSREQCESVAHTVSAIGALVPPPPPTGRPPLSTPGVIEGLLKTAGLTPVAAEDVDCPFRFPEVATAWRAFASAGQAVGVIRQVGEGPVKRAVLTSLRAFTRPDGSVLQKNRFHWVLATRPV